MLQHVSNAKWDDLLPDCDFSSLFSVPLNHNGIEVLNARKLKWKVLFKGGLIQFIMISIDVLSSPPSELASIMDIEGWSRLFTINPVLHDLRSRTTDTAAYKDAELRRPEVKS